jgi:purine nucleoside phosphorylase
MSTREHRIGIIGGSGVQLTGQEPWTVETPFGPCLLSALDEEKKVLFASRHMCTAIDSTTGKSTYAAPHEVNYKALIWALAVESNCKGGIIAMGSTGTLDPERIPVGSVVMADDYYMVRPEPLSFWGHASIGSFEAPANGEGRIHYTPADPSDEQWTSFRRRVQSALQPLLAGFGDSVRLAAGQTNELWPCAHSLSPGKDLNDSIVYVNTIGPRFETRAEIRAYQGVGHIVGMTCGREWALCEELSVPYCLVCFCDNACNGLSTHPGGALQEYLDHKKKISSVTSAVIQKLVDQFSRSVTARVG